MSKLVTREVLLAKIENTYNIDSSPVGATDALLIENLSWSHEGARMHERPAVRASLGQLKQIYGGTLLSLSFDVELKGPGSAYSVYNTPEIGVLLRGCGLSETIDVTASSEKVTYAPVSSGLESLTLYLYQDGILREVTGARGNVSFSGEAGGQFKASFSFSGHTQAVTDVALPVPTVDSTVPPVFEGAAFTIDAYPAIINSFGFDLSNQLATPPSVSAVDGYGEIQIVGRGVNGSFSPELVSIADNDFIGHWQSGKTMALTTGSVGSVQYNQFKIDMPAIYYQEVSPGDRDGIRTLELNFGATELTTDDEVSIEFS